MAGGLAHGKLPTPVSDPPRAWISITSGELTAQVDPHGAQLSSLTDRDSREILWDGDPKVWAGRAPLLFPIVGVLAGGTYRLGPKSYSLSRHGFARDKDFSVENRNSSSASLRLQADASTQQVYPFQFELDVRYELFGATLSVTTVVRNLGGTDMPASFGYHPGFRWPLPFGPPRAAHFIQFETDEPDEVRRIDAAGLLPPVVHPTPIVNRRLGLNDSPFQDDVLILDRIRSRSLTYGGREGARLRISFPDTTYLGARTKPGAPFICIQPWHRLTDPQRLSGQFSPKPGVFILKAAEGLFAKIDITL